MISLAPWWMLKKVPLAMPFGRFDSQCFVEVETSTLTFCSSIYLVGRLLGEDIYRPGTDGDGLQNMKSPTVA